MAVGVTLGTTILASPAARAAPAAPAAPAAAAAATAPAEEADPLEISIDSLNPSTIPESGRVAVTGTVTNVSDEIWEDVNLYPVLPTEAGLPITTVSELDAAAQVPADLVIGEREVSVSDQVGDLAPGAVAPYALRIPRGLLPTTEGVHWLGVHALGANAEGRDDFNDGKARTFIPLVRDAKPVPTALVLQLRARVLSTPDGRVDRPDLWASSLAPGGRLSSVVEMGAAAGSHDLTWLVDPAVISTVNSLVAGNPTRMPPRTEEPVEGEGDGESESPTPTPEAVTPSASDEALTDPGDPSTLAAVAIEGQAWLSRLQTALAGQEVLALPYGDVDASAASHLDSTALVDAQTMSATELAAQGLTSAPVLASPSGYLNPDAIANASPDTTLLVTSAAVGVEAPTVADVGGREVLLSSATAVDGGPGPDDRLATVALRQRVLAEAAVRALDNGGEPLVVTLPTDWSTTDPAEFFAGLDVDFVDLTSLSGVASSPAHPVEELAYPTFQQDFELDAANFVAAQDLIDSGTTLQQILIDNPALAGLVEREAYAGLSYWQRPRVNEARASARPLAPVDRRHPGPGHHRRPGVGDALQ